MKNLNSSGSDILFYRESFHLLV